MISDERFERLSDVPPEIEWFANITNPNTRRNYKNDVTDFMSYAGIKRPEEFRRVKRSHVIAWRDSLREARNPHTGEVFAPSTIRRKLSALSSLFEFLCDSNAVELNPVTGVRRPTEDANEGKTPAISDIQARKLLSVPPEDTLKGIRDRAILSTFLFHAPRVGEVCGLRVKDQHERRGIPHFRIRGKRGKVRYVPIHPHTQSAIHDYLIVAGHGEDRDGALFRPVRNNTTGDLGKHMTTRGVFGVIRKYSMETGIQIDASAPHALRVTGITNALEHEADISKVRAWVGHSNVSTTQLYDRRKNRAEESPTFQVAY